jgi:excisionase family DNA binding protein
MKPRDVVKYLNISRITLLKLIKKKKLPATKVGSQWRFKKKDIEGWLKKQQPRVSVGKGEISKPTK